MRFRRQALKASLTAAVVSGAPSTLYALASRQDPLEATETAGSLLLPRSEDRSKLILAAVPAHLAISLLWAAVLARLLPARRRTLWGMGAGVMIAALDLGVIGRRNERIAALPTLPQVADHIAFGYVVARMTDPDRSVAANRL